MSTFDTLITIVAGVVLFLYGLAGFSREIQHADEGAFERLTTRLTSTRLRGFALGAVLTALIQSSSAVCSVTVALVDAHAITFANSLAVMLGSNVGTTSTAWLVSAELTGIGPAFIVAGTILGAVPHHVRVFGKAIFYFGFVLFALDIVGDSLAPIKDSPLLETFLGSTASLPVAALIGALATGVVQSSSVTSGLIILLVQQGAVSPEVGVAVVVGSNAGTTVTSLIASARMSRAAQRSAIANSIFNVGGVLVLLPFLGAFGSALMGLGGAPATTVALAHLIFNLGVAAVCLALLNPLVRWLNRALPDHPVDADAADEARNPAT